MTACVLASLSEKRSLRVYVGFFFFLRVCAGQELPVRDEGLVDVLPCCSVTDCAP